MNKSLIKVPKEFESLRSRFVISKVPAVVDVSSSEGGQ